MCFRDNTVLRKSMSSGARPGFVLPMKTLDEIICSLEPQLSGL